MRVFNSESAGVGSKTVNGSKTPPLPILATPPLPTPKQQIFLRLNTASVTSKGNGKLNNFRKNYKKVPKE